MCWYAWHSSHAEPKAKAQHFTSQPSYPPALRQCATIPLLPDFVARNFTPSCAGSVRQCPGSKKFHPFLCWKCTPVPGNHGLPGARCHTSVTLPNTRLETRGWQQLNVTTRGPLSWEHTKIISVINATAHTPKSVRTRLAASPGIYRSVQLSPFHKPLQTS